MPFQSEAQRRFMYSKHPKIAKRWEREYDTPKDLPERKRNRKRQKAIEGLRKAR